MSVKQKPKSKQGKLQPLQVKFVKEYLLDFHATNAAIRAGYSEKTAQQMGSRLLLNVVIQNEISRQQAARSKRTEVTQDRVLLEIARLAFNDPRKAFDAHNNLLGVQDWPDEVAAAISSIKVTETHDQTETGESVVSYLKEIKFWDKGKQIELAGRHLGMFTDKLQVTSIDPAKVLIELKEQAEKARTAAC